MTPPAAFRATFSDWRLIKGRKVIQVILELPLEEADAAYKVLGGMPDPSKSVWCAVARLQPDAAKPAKKKQEWHELKPSAQISIRCGETAFRAFLAETFPLAWGRLEDDWSPIEKAIVFVREHCGVTSRADINSDNPQALDAWERLEWDYRTWQHAPAMGAA